MTLTVVQFPKREEPEPTRQTTAAEARDYADRAEGEEATAILIHWGDSLRMEMWGAGINAHEVLGLIDVAKAFLLQELMNPAAE